MMVLLIGAACIALGLYAGKRRADGMSWKEIACEFSRSACDLSDKAWKMFSRQFRREKRVRKSF